MTKPPSRLPQPLSTLHSKVSDPFEQQKRSAAKAFLTARSLIAFFTFAPFIAIVAAHFVEPVVLPILFDLWAMTPSWISHFIFPVVILWLAFALYTLRCRALLLYGCCECLVGAITAIFFVDFLPNKSTSTWISGVGALYVFVHGLDNIYKSLDADDRLGWNTLFFNRETKEKLS